MADNEDGSQPTPRPQPRQPSSDRGMMGGLAQALMQGAFEKFGQAFTDTGDRRGGRGPGDYPGMEAWREAGKRTADAMQHRWYQMEYKNFEDDLLTPYMNDRRKLTEDYQSLHNELDNGFWRDPTGAPVPIDTSTPEGRALLQRKRNEITTKFFNMAADMDMGLANDAQSKFGTNPLVDGRVMALIDSQSKVLQNVANPANLQSDAVMMEMLAADRNATANEKIVASQQEKKSMPTDIPSALKSPDIGVPGILQWIAWGPGQAILESDTGQRIKQGITEEFRQALIGSGEYKDEGEGTEETAKLNAELARLEPHILGKTAYEIVKQVDPRAAEATRLASPQFFEWDKKEEGPRPAGIVGRQSKRQLLDVKSVWEKQIDRKLAEYMSNSDNAEDYNSAINYVIDVWLREAIVGNVDDKEIPASAIFDPGLKTVEQRNALIEELRKYAQKNWQKSEVAREASPIPALAQSGGPFADPKLARAARRIEAARKKKGIVPEEY